MQRLDGKRRASRQVPSGFAGIRLVDIDFATEVRLARAQAKRKHPDRSDAEIDRAVFLAILEALNDPAWESVQ
jgi:hypothetical protein